MSEVNFQALIAAAAKYHFELVWPNNPNFEKDKEIWNVRLQTTPSVIAYCNETIDVQICVQWSRNNNYPLRIRSGGHHHEGMSCADGVLMIDLSQLNKIVYDNKYETAWIGPGIQLQKVYSELKLKNKIIPGGGCETVCVGGLTLGGGWGMYSRALGLTCDNLLACEVVLADNSVITVDDNQHKDLFWAIRGGGAANFGIVTNFHFKLTTYSQIKSTEEKWIGKAASQPMIDALTAIQANTIPISETWACRLFINESREVQFNKAVTQIDLGSPITDANVPLSNAFAESKLTDGASDQPKSTCLTRLPHKVSSAFVVNERIVETGTRLFAYLRSKPVYFPNAAAYISFHTFGGKIASFKPDATAFPYRDRYLLLQFQAWWTDKDDPHTQTYIDWIENLRLFLVAKEVTDGGFFNFQDAHIYQNSPRRQLMKYYYAGNLNRLIEIKNKYDKGNLFNSGMSIPLS
jgi:hypothetical protein